MVLGENKQPVPGGVQKPQAERHSFDAWGARRDPGNWAAAKQEPVGSATGDGLSAAAAQSQNVVATVGRSSSQPSGYTGHQMLDDVGLIHMNGRLYDPFLGRFCAADPYVQSPKNTQNYNRYTYVLNNPLSLVDPSGHFFGLIFGAIAAVATWIAGAVGAIIVAIGVILHAIGSLIIAAGKLLWAAVKFTLTAVKASAAWMKTVGTKLITSIKAGVGPAFKWMATNQITAGAATNAAWSGIQTARHGGSALDIWKSVARGAVIGAVSAVIGMGMHKMGTALGSIAQGGNSATGTLVHAAAHGVSGGAMTAANGGSFKDGFIGGAIGFGVGLPFGGAGGMIQGTDLGSIAARTTIAAIGGGVASKLSGGSFADGAYSAAFFHLFNSESGGWSLKGIQKGLRIFGKIPVIGDVADAVNVGISLATGDLVGAARNAAAMVPGLGTALDVYEAGTAIAEYASSKSTHQVTENYNQGKAAEQRAVLDLEAQGYTINGQGVRVTDGAGNIRYPDIIATSPGGVMEAFEVKSGNAPYKRPQSSFDMNLETNGGTSKLWNGVQTIGTKLLRY